ncbi:hypothetical protein R3P38DRAFT_2766875 [Favolaschia claudopus]|uniref:Uncharacterized protein n=1 Tax=Favolaschia claudopus TaxID=2862362 RepID=A0AAW0CX71_9AGAR
MAHCILYHRIQAYLVLAVSGTSHVTASMVYVVSIFFFVKLHDSSRLESDPAANVREYPTIADEDSKLILSVPDLWLAVLAKFIHLASTLHSPPYDVNQTMDILTGYLLGFHVTQAQQLDFAKSWKAALEHDAPDYMFVIRKLAVQPVDRASIIHPPPPPPEGFHATMVNTMSTSYMFSPIKRYTSELCWLNDPEAVKVFLEGVRLAEGREAS